MNNQTSAVFHAKISSLKNSLAAASLFTLYMLHGYITECSNAEYIIEFEQQLLGSYFDYKQL